MKANAPEKIYLQVCGDCQDNECDDCKFEDLEDNVTWCKDKIFDKDVEYTRTDAFIEKAVGRLKHYLDNGVWIANDVGVREKEAIIEDFRKYMEGE